MVRPSGHVCADPPSQLTMLQSGEPAMATLLQSSVQPAPLVQETTHGDEVHTNSQSLPSLQAHCEPAHSAAQRDC